VMLHRRGVGLKFLICVEITSKRQFVVVKEIIESRCLPDHIFGNVKSENNFCGWEIQDKKYLSNNIMPDL